MDETDEKHGDRRLKSRLTNQVKVEFIPTALVTTPANQESKNPTIITIDIKDTLLVRHQQTTPPSTNGNTSSGSRSTSDADNPEEAEEATSRSSIDVMELSKFLEDLARQRQRDSKSIGEPVEDLQPIVQWEDFSKMNVTQGKDLPNIEKESGAAECSVDVVSSSLDWIGSPSSSLARISRSSTDPDPGEEDMIKLDEEVPSDEPLENKKEEEDNVFVEPPLEEVSDVPKDGLMEEIDVYELEEDMPMDLESPSITVLEGYALVEQVVKLKHLRASMEREEGKSLKNKESVDDEAAFLDPEVVEDTVKLVEQDLKSSERLTIRGRRQHQPKKSVTFAPRVSVININTRDRKPDWRDQTFVEKFPPRLANTRRGRRGGSRKKSRDEQTQTDLMSTTPTAVAPPPEPVVTVTSAPSPSKPPPIPTVVFTNKKYGGKRTTLYADFQDQELSNIVARQRQKDADVSLDDLECAVKVQEHTPPPVPPKPKRSYYNRYSEDSLFGPSKPSYFPAAPAPLNSIYNIPKTGIERFQEIIAKQKKQRQMASGVEEEALRGSFLEVEPALGTKEQQSEIPPLMSLRVAPPPASKTKNKPKRKASKAKEVVAVEPKQTDLPTSNSLVPRRDAEQSNSGVKTSSEAVVVKSPRNQANFSHVPEHEEPAGPKIVWSSNPNLKVSEQSTKPGSSTAGPLNQTRTQGFPQFDTGDVKEPIRVMSSDELAYAIANGCKVKSIPRDAVTQISPKKKRPRYIKAKPYYNNRAEPLCSNPLMPAFGSSSDSSLSEGSTSTRQTPNPVGYERTLKVQSSLDGSKSPVPAHAKAENKRVLELRKSESKLMKAAASETFGSSRRSEYVNVKEETKRIEGHKCLFRRCKEKVGALSMGRAEATVAMEDHLWRNHRVKTCKGEGGEFVLALNMEKQIEKLRDSVKGATEVLSLLKHGDFYFVVKAGVGPDDVFYYEIHYLKDDNEVDVEDDMYIQHGFETVNGKDRDVELHEIPINVWDPVSPTLEKPENIRSIPVAELKKNYLFNGVIRMAFRVFAVANNKKASSTGEDVEEVDVDMLEVQEYVQRCKDTTFFGRPSFR